jgi:hypothetical protein
MFRGRKGEVKESIVWAIGFAIIVFLINYFRG